MIYIFIKRWYKSKKNIKQKNENNERKIRRNSLNLKKRNINFENDIRYKSTNNFHNIQNVFIEPIYLRDSQKKVFSFWFKFKIKH